MKSKRIISLLVPILIASIILSSCSRNNNNDNNKSGEEQKPKTEVVFWVLDSGPTRTDPIRKALDTFNKTNDKNIFVKYQVMYGTGGTYTPYDGKFLPAVVAGSQPDIITTGSNHHVLVKENIVEDMTPYIENDPKFVMEQFYPQKVEDSIYQGKIYSLPYQLDVNGFLIWNQDMFKKFGLDPNSPPDTIERLDYMAEKMYTLDDQGNYLTVGFSPLAWLNSWCVDTIYYTQSINEDGSPNAFNDRMIEAYEWVDRYVKKYDFNKTKKALGNADWEILTGNVGMVYGWIDNLRKLEDQKVSFNWNIAPFPRAHKDAEPLWLGGFYFSICYGTKVPAEAAEVLKYVCGEPGSEIYVKEVIEKQGKLITPVANMWVMNRYMDHMPPKYGFLMTEILPQMIIKRQMKLKVPDTYTKHFEEFREGVFQSKGEVKALLTDLQKKLEYEWQTWQNNRLEDTKTSAE